MEEHITKKANITKKAPVSGYYWYLPNKTQLTGPSSFHYFVEYARSWVNQHGGVAIYLKEGDPIYFNDLQIVLP